MKKVKFSDKNEILDFYKDKPVISISNKTNKNKKINNNKKNNKSNNKINTIQSQQNKITNINKIINITSASSMIILTGILIRYLWKRKL